MFSFAAPEYVSGRRQFLQGNISPFVACQGLEFEDVESPFEWLLDHPAYARAVAFHVSPRRTKRPRAIAVESHYLIQMPFVLRVFHEARAYLVSADSSAKSPVNDALREYQHVPRLRLQGHRGDLFRPHPKEPCVGTMRPLTERRQQIGDHSDDASRESRGGIRHPWSGGRGRWQSSPIPSHHRVCRRRARAYRPREGGPPSRRARSPAPAATPVSGGCAHRRSGLASPDGAPATAVRTGSTSVW